MKHKMMKKYNVTPEEWYILSVPVNRLIAFKNGGGKEPGVEIDMDNPRNRELLIKRGFQIKEVKDGVISPIQQGTSN